MNGKNKKAKTPAIPDAGNMHVALRHDPDGHLFVSSPFTYDDDIQSVSHYGFVPSDEQIVKLEAQGFTVIKGEGGAVMLIAPKA